jgi:hypothetical protein
MNRASAAALPAPVVNPMVALQRRAFGFGGPGSTIQLVLAVGGPIVAMLLCSGRVVGAVVVAAVLIPTPALLAIVALRGRSSWPAQAVLGWLDREAAVQWQSDTASRMPRSSAQAMAWLNGHAEEDVPRDVWVAALLMAGRVDEARERIGRLPATTPAELHRQCDLLLAADSADGRPIETRATAAGESAAADEVASPPARSAHVAYHAAVAATGRGSEGLGLLTAARPAIGRLPFRLSLQLSVIRFRFVLVSALFGAWLLVAVLVGLATSGGVVWF